MIKKIYLTIILLLFSFAVFGDYTMPIGIPDPDGEFGSFDPLDDAFPSQPGTWISDQAGYYYVDNTSGSCSDAGRGNLSVPRCTPPVAATFTARGDTVGSTTILVVIAGGTSGSPYTATYNLAGIAGTAAHPVYIRGASSETYTIFEPNATRDIMTISDSSYIYVENIYFKGTNVNGAGPAYDAGISITESTNHIVFRNCDVKEFPLVGPISAVQIYMSSGWAEGEVNNYIVFYNVDFQHIGTTGWGPEQDIYARIGIKCQDGVDHIWILASDYQQIGEDGIHVLRYSNPSRGATPNPEYIYIGGNTFYQMVEQAGDFKEAEHIIVSENVVHGLHEIYLEDWCIDCDGGANGVAFTTNLTESAVQGFTSVDDIWFINNIIYDISCGLYFQTDRSNYAIGNLIYDLVSGGSLATAGKGFFVDQPYATSTAIMYAVNNTIVNAPYPFHLKQAYTSYIHNNILYELVTQTNYHLRIGNNNGYELKNNLFYDATAIRLYNAAYCTGSNTCINSGASTDPEFTNLSTDDYTMTDGGNAVDVGYDSPIYDTFYSLYGLDISKDILGVTRPQNTTMDVGAYEYDSGSVTATISGTITSGTTEAHMRTGSRTLVIDITNDTLETFNDTIRAAVVAGLNASSSQNTTDWSSLVEGDENSWSATGVVRTDDNTITITFPDFDGDTNTRYNIITNESINNIILPASALVTSTDPINVGGSFTITALDEEPPVFVSAELIDGTHLKVTYNSAIQFGAGGESGGTLSDCSGGATILSDPVITTNYVTWLINRIVDGAETGCVHGYSQPTNGLQDTATIPNDVVTYSGEAVTNNAPVAGNNNKLSTSQAVSGGASAQACSGCSTMRAY